MLIDAFFMSVQLKGVLNCDTAEAFKLQRL